MFLVHIVHSKTKKASLFCFDLPLQLSWEELWNGHLCVFVCHIFLSSVSEFWKNFILHARHVVDKETTDQSQLQILSGVDLMCINRQSSSLQDIGAQKKATKTEILGMSRELKLTCQKADHAAIQEVMEVRTPVGLHDVLDFRFLSVATPMRNSWNETKADRIVDGGWPERRIGDTCGCLAQWHHHYHLQFSSSSPKNRKSSLCQSNFPLSLKKANF